MMASGRTEGGVDDGGEELEGGDEETYGGGGEENPPGTRMLSEDGAMLPVPPL